MRDFLDCSLSFLLNSNTFLLFLFYSHLSSPLSHFIQSYLAFFLFFPFIIPSFLTSCNTVFAWAVVHYCLVLSYFILPCLFISSSFTGALSMINSETYSTLSPRSSFQTPWKYIRPPQGQSPPPPLTLMSVLREHSASVNKLAVSPDQSYFASGSSDCTVKIWQLKGLDKAAFPRFPSVSIIISVFALVYAIYLLL